MAVRAPDFRPELEWVNTAGRTLSLRDFAGRFALLDFWSYGCINCLHLLDEMRRVEGCFGDALAVVGVHSGKFVNERSTASIARACERLGVRHPVVNDRHFRTWREYAVKAWPTLVLVSPTGYVVGVRQGEVEADALRRWLADATGVEPRPEAPERVAAPGPALRFPAGVLASGDGRLRISDTGHHRVLEVALTPDGLAGRVERVFGSGASGGRDGAPGAASFRSPRGLALAAGELVVADAGGHRVRGVELASGEVRTLAGTGTQARPRSAAGPAREVALNSPWDVLCEDGVLRVAMAGSHQIWSVDPAGGRAEPYVGSGAEGLHDDTLPWAALAQPSGLAAGRGELWVVDAESSAVRAVRPEGTATVVGTGLFDFGDRDGSGDEVRLQHPQGIAWWEGGERLVVADSYNHRIKLVDPATRAAVTLAGDGEPGLRDGPAGEARLWEPGGISVDPRRPLAYVADTNNHAIRVVDLTGGAVHTLRLHFP